MLGTLCGYAVVPLDHVVGRIAAAFSGRVDAALSGKPAGKVVKLGKRAG